MRTAQTLFCKLSINRIGEAGISKIEQFDATPDLVFAQK